MNDYCRIASEIYFAFRGNGFSLRRTGCASAGDVTGRDVLSLPRGKTTHCRSLRIFPRLYFSSLHVSSTLFPFVPASSLSLRFSITYAFDRLVLLSLLAKHLVLILNFLSLHHLLTVMYDM